jgi:recombination protein RecA
MASSKLDKITKGINKKYEGSVKRASELEDNVIIPTGSLLLNEATGVGGFPLGRSIELYGNEGSGKSTLAMSVVAEAQKMGYNCGYIDIEEVYDKARAAQIGVDNEELILVQTEGGEVSLNILEAYIRSGEMSVLVVDSVAGLAPEAELEGEMEDQQMALQARLMSKAMRKLTAAMSKNNVLVIWINQIREKVGVMFGNPETTPGGRALKFYSTMRIRVRGLKPIKFDKQEVGHPVKCKIVKNKVAPPYRIAEFNLFYDDRCIDNVAEVIDVATDKGIIDISGSWYSYESDDGSDHKQQGRDNFAEYLRLHDEVFDEIKAHVQEDNNNDDDDDEDDDLEKAG